MEGGTAIRAITLTQPWATLVAIGAKRIETRSWMTHYRGELAIHAAKGFPREARELCDEEPFYSALEAAGFYRYFRAGSGHGDRGPWSTVLPIGVVIATCRLVGCFRITRSVTYQLATGEYIGLAEPERSFGDYTPGRFGWLLADVKMLPEPIPVKGALGLWEWGAR